jgi:hypothetical protein
MTELRCNKKASPANAVLLSLAALVCWHLLVPGAVVAEDEWRVGLMLQLPFGGSQERGFVHFANTRIGAKLQYAEVDDVVKRNEQTVERIYFGEELKSSEVTSEEVVKVENGDKVVGGEAYIMVTPFNGLWNVSGGVNGFSGSNTIQGVGGLGYDPLLGGYLAVGALMPYSQVGLRFNFRYIDYYLGATSLPKFSSTTVWEEDLIVYEDKVIEPPAGEVVDGGESPVD